MLCVVPLCVSTVLLYSTYSTYSTYKAPHSPHPFGTDTNNVQFHPTIKSFESTLYNLQSTVYKVLIPKFALTPSS